MRITKKVIYEKDELSNIICNMCGEDIEKSEFGDFFDHLSIEKKWGYFSSNDGITHKFDICEKCYIEIINKFKIKDFDKK